MKEVFLKQLKKLKVSRNTNILLAVSGGMDSMVLLDLLHETDHRFSVAHCNFCLRGEESDMDEKFVQSTCVDKKIKFFSTTFNTVEYSKQNKLSTQMAARKLRYDWFKMLKEKHNFNIVATAHHCNDSVETLLINLVRGTGIAGLHGIPEMEQDIIRPLLSFTKNEIYLYAKNNHIAYCEDSSNRDDKYVRNKIRNKIIPIMEEINPHVIESIGKTISRIQDVESVYKNSVAEKKKKLVLKKNHEYKINIDDLLQELSPKQLLYEIISDFGFYDVEAVFASLFSESGKEFINADFYMIKDRFHLIIVTHIVNHSVVIYNDVSKIGKPFNITFLTANYNEVVIDQAPSKAMYIDYDKLEFPLLIRPWRTGDVFMPLGMKGFKKISDYFIDEKFSLIDKKKAKLLISNNKIVCVIGKRIDERFKLVENSKKVYIVKL